MFGFLKRLRKLPVVAPVVALLAAAVDPPKDWGLWVQNLDYSFIGSEEEKQLGVLARFARRYSPGRWHGDVPGETKAMTEAQARKSADFMNQCFRYGEFGKAEARPLAPPPA